MDDLLQLACERGCAPISVELASQALSSSRQRYVSASEVLCEIEALRLGGLLSFCAPDEFITRSSWPYVRATIAGREHVTAQTRSLDAEAWRMWIQSSSS